MTQDIESKLDAFKLDTSGVVLIPESDGPSAPKMRVVFAGLTPFAQGYTAKALERASLLALAGFEPGSGEPPTPRVVPFHMLAPETVARIMEISESYARAFTLRNTPEGQIKQGRELWLFQQEEVLPGFPPVAPYIGDDGMVYLRESA